MSASNKSGDAATTQQQVSGFDWILRYIGLGWKTLEYYIPSAVAIAAMVLIWDLAVRFGDIKSYILPPPADVVNVLFESNYRWWSNFQATAYACVGGFAASTVFGIVMGVVIVWNKTLERAILPLLILFNTLPKVALAPLFVIWLGYGIVPNIVIAVTVAFFPVVINTAVGLTKVEPELLELVRCLRASKIQIFAKIRFPNAIPYIFAGLKMNATLSVIGAIVGEFVASEKGLGALIISGGVTLDTASIFASLILISVLGLAIYVVVVIAERWIAPWQQREESF